MIWPGIASIPATSSGLAGLKLRRIGGGKGPPRARRRSKGAWSTSTPGKIVSSSMRHGRSLRGAIPGSAPRNATLWLLWTTTTADRWASMPQVTMQRPEENQACYDNIEMPTLPAMRLSLLALFVAAPR
eukprot:CAMPEP_0115160728 /NCGR_PEP_ID=MMETSP0227-20121206/70972_1 /TAXON_ID=89957 /ORGANISM="Polarella glacialis, Strain CCMP 1383" /LENGTH=128 /DNA_ID=CAMNT_0002572669 /DNA_START=21 /DNA_END=404 /DNA_ORIENTATION=+